LSDDKTFFFSKPLPPQPGSHLDQQGNRNELLAPAAP
jgi:hypothetical protein